MTRKPPGPTTAPETFPEADAIFGGEVEGREAELLALIEAQRPAAHAPAGEQRRVDLDKSARPVCWPIRRCWTAGRTTSGSSTCSRT